MIIGYARVSTTGQNLAEQLDQLNAAGCNKIYQEKISGKDAERPELKRMMYNLKQGDVIIITKLDRLARSTRDLLNITYQFGEAKVGFKVLDNPALDTTTMHGKLLFDIIGAIGEFERKLIAARTAEGRKRAMAAGRKFGRKAKMTQEQRVEALQLLANGKGWTLQEVAKRFGVHESTICRLHQQRLTVDAALAAHSNGEIRRGH